MPANLMAILISNVRYLYWGGDNADGIYGMVKSRLSANFVTLRLIGTDHGQYWAVKILDIIET